MVMTILAVLAISFMFFSGIISQTYALSMVATFIIANRMGILTN
jgi:hypothetical protein